MSMTRIDYAVCIHGWESIYSLHLQLFYKNEILFKVRRPTDSHVHRKSGSIKEMVRDKHVAATHQ